MQEEGHYVERYPDQPGFASQLAMQEQHGVNNSAKAGYYKEWDSIYAALVQRDVVLVKGNWLETFAANGKGRGLPRRQEVPWEAVWKVEDLMADVRDFNRTTPQVLSISYSWLTRPHPDPEGYHLQKFAPLLKHFARQKRIGTENLAVFIDWCSVPQRPMNQQDLAIFQRGLKFCDIWYAHSLTEVWMLTDTPQGITPYEDRGWTKFERALASLSKPPEQVLDLGKVPTAWKNWQQLEKECQAKRTPPQSPEAFENDLKTKVFTVADDRETVAAKYKDTFIRALASEEQLWFAGLGWGDKEAIELARILPSCMALKTLELGGNELSATGASALMEVLVICPSLEFLCLDKNQLPEKAVQNFRAAWEAARKPLDGLDLGDQQVRSSIVPKDIKSNKATTAEQLNQLLARQAAFEARIESAVTKVSDSLVEVAENIGPAGHGPRGRH